MIFDTTIKDVLQSKIIELETQLDADVAFYYGELNQGLLRLFRDFIEELKDDPAHNRNRLAVILNTPGGTAEAVEKMVDIIRFHYQEVYFIVPDYALSAGTIFCMSGNKIYMDYSSSLGPIDPQVFNGKTYVPALGYLDKVEEMLKKDSLGQLTRAEFLILQQQDLAMLSRYEQAKNLTITLLKKWLVDYKFGDWTEHQTTPSKIGTPVTQDEKEERATEIAEMLGSNKLWHSHGRMIGIDTLRNILRLKIEDYSNDTVLRPLIRSYNDLITEYLAKSQVEIFMHSRNYF
jgi:Serine dehydrogenase proteinase